MARFAVDDVDRIFRPGFRYSKAEILLLDLRNPGEFTEDLFARGQSATSDKVMGVLDPINGRWRRGTLCAASVPVNRTGPCIGK